MYENIDDFETHVVQAEWETYEVDANGQACDYSGEEAECEYQRYNVLFDDGSHLCYQEEFGSLDVLNDGEDSLGSCFMEVGLDLCDIPEKPAAK